MAEAILRWGDGYCIVTPSFPDVLLKKLKYWRRTMGWSEQQMRRVAAGEYQELYSLKTWIDEDQRYHQELTTMPGFLHRIKQVLRDEGWTYTVVDERTQMPQPDLIRACQDLRDYQVPIAYTAIVSGGGIVSAATGMGKTYIIKAIADAYSHADLQARGTPLTVIAAPDQDITAKNFRDIKALLPHREVGLVMAGYSNFSDDIQVITLDSLHRINPEEVGVLIVDEVHAAASDDRTEDLLKMRRAARWGVSATPTGRFDGRDLVTEGIFGPVVYQYSFQDGVRDGALVPIKVYWIQSPEPTIGMERYAKFRMRTAKLRHGVTNNLARNKLVGEIMTRIDPAHQTLCIMQYLGHMNELRPHCGEGVEIVHADTDPKKFVGLRNLYPISSKERRAIYGKMEAAEVRKILSTYVYKQGVNFPHLEVVVNAGGGGSEIVAKQIPGRESRKVGDKECSYLVDFWHPWDRETDKRKRLVAGPIHRDDQQREKVYEQLGFGQIWANNLTELPFLKGQFPQV